MPFLYILIAILLIALVLVDFFVTVLHLSGAGPLTGLWSGRLWWAALKVHWRWPNHLMLSVIGPLVLLLTIGIWYLLTTAALFLLFIAGDGAVVTSPGGERATLEQTLYFVTTTLSSLGYGDLVPSRFPWTLVATFGTFFATVILAVSLSYVLAVVAAVIERRNLAFAINGLGSSPPGIVDKLESDKSVLENYLISLSVEINKQALKQRTYPIVLFFHPREEELALSRALLLLADTMFLVERLPEERRLAPSVPQLVNRSICHYLGMTPIPSSVLEEESSSRMREMAKKIEIEDAEEDFDRALDGYLETREQLLLLARGDGWY